MRRAVALKSRPGKSRRAVNVNFAAAALIQQPVSFARKTEEKRERERERERTRVKETE